MLSVAALSGGQGNYYLALARDDYYLKGGEPPGRWLGEGAVQLGLTGAVESQAFKHLLQGFSADGRDPLIQGAGSPKHQPGWDLTFSCPKSVSAVWSQADGDVRQAIQEAQAAAVRGALDYLQDAAAYTRRGKGGLTREPTKLVVATFDHGTSRAQDPQLHTHCLVLNVGVREDGTTGTILSEPFYRHKLAAGAVYRAELSDQLEKRLGVVLERERSWFEVKGVPERLIEEFSKRRQQVEKALAERGAEGAKAAAKLTLATRQAKEHLPRSELLAAWQDVGRAHGFTAGEVNGLLLKQGHRQDLAGRVSGCIRAAVERITRHESHFPERELIRHAAEEAQAMGVAASVLRHKVKEELSRSPEIVCLGRVKGEIHYTTREMLALEEKLLGEVEALKALPSRPVGEKTISSVKGRLSDEQKQALRHVTQSTGSIQVVSGMAGTGKTSMLRAAREAFEREGYEVVGACLSGKAVQGLEDGAGIKSSTLAKLIGLPEFGYRGDLEKGLRQTAGDCARQVGRAALGKKTWQTERIRLGPKTVLVVDEAGMVGTRQMQRLTEKVLAAGARLVLVGDEKQLQAIDAGGPFASIGARLGRATLTDIQRQREPWAREAVKQIAHGHGRQALQEYARRGLVAVADDRNGAMHALVRSWKRMGANNPRDHLILASTNMEATVLNRMAQVERTLAGALGKRGLSVAGSDFHRGDRILFTRNSKRYGVENGCLGSVVGVDTAHQILTVKLDKGKTVMIPVKDYEHLKLGYAVTTHKSQGATTENAYVLLGGPTQDRELSYVQASRARGTTRFFLDKLDAGEDLRELCKQLERSRQKDLSHDVLERRGRESKESQGSVGYQIG
jgi:conjugative relaxase-like TrwC/TraI family protein